MSKKRLYSDEYIKYGFVSITKNEIQYPQCVICLQTLSNDALRPSRLLRHLETKHASLKDSPKQFFESKVSGVKNSRLDASGTFQQQTKKCLTASYEIAHLIALDKKPHSVGESLIKPSILVAAQHVLGQSAEEKVSQISLSNNTIKSRLDEMAADIMQQVIEDLRTCSEFSLQCDESTDIASCSHLSVFVRYAKEAHFCEEFLFSQEMESTCKGIDVFNVINDWVCMLLQVFNSSS